MVRVFSGFYHQRKRSNQFKEGVGFMGMALNLNRAMHDIRESGECRVMDPFLKEMLEEELKEMGIGYDIYKQPAGWIIIQKEED
jgi:hypothetical protein